MHKTESLGFKTFYSSIKSDILSTKPLSSLSKKQREEKKK
jgi:hypothetical protein